MHELISVGRRAFELLSSWWNSVLHPEWGSFIPGLAVAVIATLLIPAYLNWRNRPRLQFLFRSKTDTGYHTHIELDDLEGLIVKNNSRNKFDTVYWTIYIPNQLNPKVDPSKKEKPVLRPIPDGPYSHLSGQITSPIFPDRPKDPDFTFKIEKVPGKWPLYYFFSTERGILPKRATRVVNSNHPRSVLEALRYMDKLEICVTEEK